MEVIFAGMGGAKHRVHGLALIVRIAKYSGTQNPEGQVGTTMVKSMKMGTPQIGSASSPPPTISGEISEPAAFLLSGNWQFPKTDSRRSASPFASFPRTTLKDQLWVACPQSTHELHVPQVFRGLLLGTTAAPQALGQFQQLFVTMSSPRRPHDTCMKGNLHHGAGRDQVRASEHPCSCFPSNSSSCFPLHIPFLSPKQGKTVSISQPHKPGIRGVQ